jgi:hypothetical protein
MFHSKLLSLLTVAFVLASCSQTQAVTRSVSPAATSSATATTDVIPLTSSKPEAPAQPEKDVESEPEAEELIEPAIFDPADIAADYHQKLEAIMSRPCNKLSKTENETVYMICVTAGTGGDGDIVLASSWNQEAGAGVEFWYAETGKVYAIRFYHTGETFIFDAEDGSLKVELVGDNQIRTEFSIEERNRLEDQAENGVNSVFDRFRGESE